MGQPPHGDTAVPSGFHEVVRRRIARHEDALRSGGSPRLFAAVRHLMVRSSARRSPTAPLYLRRGAPRRAGWRRSHAGEEIEAIVFRPWVTIYASPRRIRRAAKPNRTIAYRQNTPNPVHGGSDVAWSGWAMVTARPAPAGRSPTSPDQFPGSNPATICTANSRPNSAAIPPAVLRSKVPGPGRAARPPPGKALRR